MKYIAVLFVAGGIFALLAHHSTQMPSLNIPGSDQSDSATPGTDFLKAPLDRTHEVMNQAKTRAQDPSLQ